jgi:hypothetical protein
MDTISKNHSPHMRMWIAFLGYVTAVNNRIHIPFLYIYIYIINPTKRRRFGLGIGYVYIGLVGCVAFLCNIWVKRRKQCEINIYSKDHGLKRK